MAYSRNTDAPAAAPNLIDSALLAGFLIQPLYHHIYGQSNVADADVIRTLVGLCKDSSGDGFGVDQRFPLLMVQHKWLEKILLSTKKENVLVHQLGVQKLLVHGHFPADHIQKVCLLGYEESVVDHMLHHGGFHLHAYSRSH